VSAGSWVGDYLGSILPGLPIWIKDLGGYPGAYVAGDRYGTRVGPPSWLADCLRDAEAAATVHHGTWIGAPKTARVVPREVALELLDRRPDRPATARWRHGETSSGAREPALRARTAKSVGGIRPQRRSRHSAERAADGMTVDTADRPVVQRARDVTVQV
jgi:hypothetical protein